MREIELLVCDGEFNIKWGNLETQSEQTALHKAFTSRTADRNKKEKCTTCSLKIRRCFIRKSCPSIAVDLFAISLLAF